MSGSYARHIVTFGAHRSQERAAVPVRSGFYGNPAAFENCARQREALARMGECERQTGKTAEELRAVQQEQRARVLARYGVNDGGGKS